MEEAVQELRKPENRVSHEAFGIAWYDVFTNLEGPADSAITELFAAVPLYVIEKTEGLTLKLKNILRQELQSRQKGGTGTYNANLDTTERISAESRLRETELYLEYLTGLPRFRDRAVQFAEQFISGLKGVVNSPYEKLLGFCAHNLFNVDPDDREFNPLLNGDADRKVEETVIGCAKKDGEQSLHYVCHVYRNGVGKSGLFPHRNPHICVMEMSTPKSIREKAIQYLSEIIEEKKAQYVKSA